MRTKKYNIAINYSTMRSYGSRLYETVVSYFANKPQFQILIAGIHTRDSMNLEKIDGIIGFEPTDQIPEVSERKIKVIRIDDYYYPENSCLIGSDNSLVAEMAFNYYKDKAYDNIAFISHRIAFKSEIMLARFHELAAQSTINFHHYYAWGDNEPDRVPMINWLKSLPKPTGLVIQDDQMADWLKKFFKLAECNIPDELALLSIQNDALGTRTYDPPLSSIDLNIEKIGTIASQKMEEALLNNTPFDFDHIVVPPIGIVERASTNRHATEDDDVLHALELIKAHADQPYRVNDLFKDMPISRRQLERKFREELNCSLLDEIQRAHIKHAKELLLNTDLKVLEVAIRSGYANIGSFTRVFTKLNGQTPGQWRKANRTS